MRPNRADIHPLLILLGIFIIQKRWSEGCERGGKRRERSVPLALKFKLEANWRR
jgi:hypothetical protein